MVPGFHVEKIVKQYRTQHDRHVQRRIVHALPAEYRQVLQQFHRAALLRCRAVVERLRVDLRAEVLQDVHFMLQEAEQFGLGQAPGLVEVLSGDASPSDVVRPLPERSLRIVPAGLALDNSARAVRSNASTQRIRELAGGTPFVVVDLPAAFSSTSTPILARFCDAVIVVARSGRTSKRDLSLTLDRLSESNVVGVVLNRWSSRIPAFVERLLGLGR